MSEAGQEMQMEAGLPVSEVETLLSTLGKALRAFNMYQENNPVFRRFQHAVRDAFAGLWSAVDQVTVLVTEHGFRYGDRVIAVGEGRDSLAFAIYKDGVRSLTFRRGFEDEVHDFLQAVNRAMKREEDADDLISVLWEKDFAALQYGYVDLLMEGVAVPDAARSEPDRLDGGTYAQEVAEAESGALESAGTEQPSPTPISLDDFDETLYFLDATEVAALEEEVRKEMERDLRRDVLNALFDRLEEPLPERQENILDILEQLLPLLLSRGDMRNAGRVLEELGRLQQDDQRLPSRLRDRVDRLFARLSDPEVLEQFVQAVADGAVAPDSHEVNLFFSRLRADALPVLIRFAQTAESADVRSRLATALDALAERHPETVTELLGSDDPSILEGTVRAVGRIGMTAAVAPLHDALDRAGRDVRMAVVEALVRLRVTPALQALTTALDDDDREVRVAAARALGDVRFASARPALEAVVEGKRIRGADLTEKMAFFEAYGAVVGSTGVERLDELLNGKSFLRRRQPTEIRACAALGLGRVGTDRAREALERARYDDDPIVKNAVLRALGGEGEAG